MQILIISDLHNNISIFNDFIEKNKFKTIIFLGDGLSNFFKVVQKNKIDFFYIEGNCDSFFPRTDYKIIEINNLKIMITHGDAFKVKSGIFLLESFVSSLKNRPDIVLFGHTHEPFHILKEEIEYFNPGAFADGFYGILNIENEYFYIESNIFNKVKK
ncbi:MAG TPA: YfcE family phosphodiesterase [Spirochaetota bacterium]|nr:YfcE family phosphodiesterase [Spirochaetota bacterium]HOM38219.1 YfcE family phosphodiesterase [Spirochaetota bacterium]HPQ48563.1 YfcE family phosphodiesterase [Spirochaetota bacterium]